MKFTSDQWAAIRKVIYGLVPLIGTALVSFGIVSGEQWAQISAPILAILGVVLAFLHTSPADVAELEEHRANAEFIEDAPPVEPPADEPVERGDHADPNAEEALLAMARDNR